MVDSERRDRDHYEPATRCAADTGEHYFLVCNGNRYLGIPTRNSTKEIEKIIIYNLKNSNMGNGETYADDYFGCVVEIDASEELTITRYDFVHEI